MAKVKFGIAVDEDLATEVDELVDECDDLGASRSEIIEAILTAYVRSDADHAERVRELIIRRRNGTLWYTVTSSKMRALDARCSNDSIPKIQNGVGLMTELA